VRSPLQGGPLPADTVVGAIVEIACDESGFSGTNMLHAATPVITHASVDLGADEAAGVITRLRSELRFSPHEYKSGQFLRSLLLRGQRPGEALDWFGSTLTGRAYVHRVDKEFFLATRIIDLLLSEPSYTAGTRMSQDRRSDALALYRAGRPAGSDWRAFLAAFVDLVRTKRRHPAAVEKFFHARDALLRAGLGAPATAVLNELSPTRVRDVATRLHNDDRSIPPPLEPLLPALGETVLSWSGGVRQVLVIHDEQSALTADRLTRLQRALAAAGPGLPSADTAALPAGVSPLAGLVMADSRDDPRVQVADLLAGVARRLPAVGDDAVLRPLLTPTSLLPT